MTHRAPTSPAAATPSPWSPAPLAALVAITLVGALLRAYGLGEWSLSEREAATWRAITLPLGADDDLGLGVPGQAPLTHFVLWWLIDSGLLPSHGEGWLRLPFAVAGIAAIPLLAWLARPRFGLRGALIGSALLAVHPLGVASSQAMQPAPLVAVLAFLALGAAQRRARSLAGCAVLAAAFAAPAGWVVAAGALAAAAPGRWQPRLAAIATGVAVPSLLLLAPAWTWPIVLLAIVGAANAAPASVPMRTLTAWLVVGHAVAWSVGIVDRLDAAVALPLLALFAGGGAVDLFHRARATLAAPSMPAGVASALPFVLAGAWLAVDTFLHLTVYRGERPPWRAAADLVLRARDRGGACVVGADAGVLPLLCYLRPNHWRDRTRDPHPGLAVQALRPLTGGDTLDRLAAAVEPQVFVVLRDDELRGLEAPARLALDRGFVLQAAMPNPAPHGNATLHVFTRRAAR